MKDKRAEALKLVERLVALNPDDEGMALRARQIRDRLKLPMSVVLEKVPGKSVADKARHLGVSRQSFYAWLHGISRPSWPQAQKLAKVTGFDADDIHGAGSTPAPRARRASA